MRFANYTPHAVVVFIADADFNGPAEEKTFPSEGVARVDQITSYVDTIDNIPIYRSFLGNVEGLPAPEDGGVLYIVSAIVKAAVPERKDLVSPGRLIRDADGVVIGCEGFIH